MTPEPLLQVSVNDRSRGVAADAAALAALLDSAYRARRKKPASLDLLLADDAEMSRLNRRHLSKEGATDVLAFDDGEEEAGRVRLGDVAVGWETARREAEGRGGDFAMELAFYALHGLFHLLGMRDDSDADRARMHQAQAKAMRDFGLEPGSDFPLFEA